MKPSELRVMPEPELRKQLAQTREELTRLSLTAKQGAVEQPHRICQMKRDIARMLTVLTEQRTSHEPGRS